MDTSQGLIDLFAIIARKHGVETIEVNGGTNDAAFVATLAEFVTALAARAAAPVSARPDINDGNVLVDLMQTWELAERGPKAQAAYDAIIAHIYAWAAPVSGQAAQEQAQPTDGPDGYIAIAMVGSTRTKVAFNNVAAARRECIAGNITPYWTAPVAAQPQAASVAPVESPYAKALTQLLDGQVVTRMEYEPLEAWAFRALSYALAAPAPTGASQSAELTELRRLAMKAHPGPWRAGGTSIMAPETEDHLEITFRASNGNRDVLRHTTNYFCAANPTAILRLLDALATPPAAMPAQATKE